MISRELEWWEAAFRAGFHAPGVSGSSLGDRHQHGHQTGPMDTEMDISWSAIQNPNQGRMPGQ